MVRSFACACVKPLPEFIYYRARYLVERERVARNSHFVSCFRRQPKRILYYLKIVPYYIIIYVRSKNKTKKKNKQNLQYRVRIRFFCVFIIVRRPGMVVFIIEYALRRRPITALSSIEIYFTRYMDIPETYVYYIRTIKANVRKEIQENYHNLDPLIHRSSSQNRITHNIVHVYVLLKTNGQ